MPGRLKEGPAYVCRRCRGDPEVRPIDGHTVISVPVDDSTLEMVSAFCYLGDVLEAGGGCTLHKGNYCQMLCCLG